jgi:hypothetical protein
MSTVLIVATPLVIAGWPVLTAAISAAVATMGFAASQSGVPQSRRVADGAARAEIEVEDCEILAGATGAGESMTVERDGIRATFSRDARGALKLCLEGHHLSKAELRRLGDELIGRVTQQYAYHRVVSELKQRQMNIVDERVGEDQVIRIRVRNV